MLFSFQTPMIPRDVPFEYRGLPRVKSIFADQVQKQNDPYNFGSPVPKEDDMDLISQQNIDAQVSCFIFVRDWRLQA